MIWKKRRILSLKNSHLSTDVTYYRSVYFLMQQFWCDNYNVSKLKRDNTKNRYLFSMYLKCDNVSIPQPPRENVLERRLQLVHSGKLVLLFIGCLKTILKCRCYVINTAPQSALTFIRVGIFWGGGVFQLLIGGIQTLIILRLQTPLNSHRFLCVPSQQMHESRI